MRSLPDSLRQGSDSFRKTSRLVKYTTPYGASVPNKPRTPARTVRVDDELWEAAQRKASDRNETLSDVIRRLLREWIRGYEG